MSLRVHCDVCGAEMENRGQIWPNQLPKDDRLRDVSAKMEFTEHHGKKVDLCNTCLSRWLKGVQ